ncbi:MAG: outer membrane beta-barrel protein [Gammaproteobacteria bacterium]|jgi:outer membrane protein|uniref:OmpW family outer membrane protein n=1 Tax=Marinomonas TaxID=28253 RepID=UPI000C1F4481|nr:MULTISPECIES: OmpW family outer membrane protein [unclassified Marinomonas]MBU2177572.1 outer membrane beta-barrel protein [Gammaproteobacteria bacterium]PJE56767.1 membrane protein [Marinomonas sp. BSi20584]
MKALLPVALVSALCSSVALAHNAGDVFARAGLAVVMPNESSDDVLNKGELELDSDTQVGVTLTYMLTDQFGVELLAASPFTHKVSTKGLGEVAEVSHLPPSLMAQYYFGQANSKIRPYIGAGLNYTIFFDEKGKGALAGTDVSLDNSFGLAAQVGVDVNFAENWFANASLWYMDINTDVHTTVGTFNADIDPITFMASVGYTF